MRPASKEVNSLSARKARIGLNLLLNPMNLRIGLNSSRKKFGRLRRDSGWSGKRKSKPKRIPRSIAILKTNAEC
jgi:hypothetical protein